MLLVAITVPDLSSQHITKGKGKNLRFYLSNDFSIEDNPQLVGKPLFGRVRHTYVPPEVLKEVPSQTIIQNAEGFELVNISPGNNAQSETWIAINPANPNNIIATANDNNYMFGDYKMSSWASTDGGRTWKHANTPANRGLLIDRLGSNTMTIFDPSIAFDSDGNAYYCYGFTQINNSQQFPDDNGVFLAKSTDGGLSWNGDFNGDPITAVAVELGNKPSQPFHDRYTMASDLSEGSPYKDNIYVAWQKFQALNNEVLLAISADGGVSWNNPISLYSGDNSQSPVPVVGPEGEVYVIWQVRNRNNHTTQGVVRRSENGGASWSTSLAAMEVFTVGEIDPAINESRYIMTKKQNIRVSSYPAISVDCTPVGSPTRGHAYVVMAGRDAPNGDYGIYMSKSTNKGQSWSPKKRIDDATLRNDMFFPAVSVDKTNGMISVLYYSSQNDPNNVGVDAYIAISRDGGETFKNIRLTPSSIYLSHGGTVSQQDIQGSNVYWGDYTSIASYGGKVYPLWWWPSGANYNYGTLDLYTALIAANPKPPTNYKAISQFIDEKVKIKMTWTNPTHDLLGDELGDFTLEIFRDYAKIATLDKATTEYFDTQVEDGKNYFYQIRAVLPNGDYSIFAEQTLYAGGSQKPAPPAMVVAKPHPDGILVEWINPETSVDGSDIRNLEKINIYQNGNLIASAGKDKIAAGSKSSHVIILPTKQFYSVKLKAATLRNDIETESDYSEEAFSYAGQPIQNFMDNFDSEVSRIPTHNMVGTWGTTNIKAASAPLSLTQSPGSEKYAPNTQYRMLMAPTVIDASKKRLNFNYLAKIHTSDFGHVFVSKDFGKTFIEIMRFNSNSHPDFKATKLEDCQFVNVSYDLTEYIGDTLYIMLGLTTSPILEDFGLLIDDLMLDGEVGVEEHYNPIYNSLSAQVSPNPTNSLGSLSLLVPTTGNLNIDIFDMLGNKVMNVVNTYSTAGSFDYSFDLSSRPAGTYFARISLNGFTKTIPIIKQ